MLLTAAVGMRYPDYWAIQVPSKNFARQPTGGIGHQRGGVADSPLHALHHRGDPRVVRVGTPGGEPILWQIGDFDLLATMTVEILPQYRDETPLTIVDRVADLAPGMAHQLPDVHRFVTMDRHHQRTASSEGNTCGVVGSHGG